jgi:hypothetical protein
VVGKSAKRQRRQGSEQRRTQPQAALLAERADRAAALVLAKLDENLTLLTGSMDRRFRSDVTTWPSRRNRLLTLGYSWPEWSWIPYTLVLNAVYGDVHEVLSPVATLGDLEAIIVPAVPVLNWLPGRIAVRYDPDIVDTFVATPIDHKIPTQALYRLPSFGLFLDCPWLAEGAGVFACIDPGQIDSPPGDDPVHGIDELLLTFVLPDKVPPLVQASIWFPEGSITAALEAQDRQPRLPGVVREAVHADRDSISDHFGQPFAQVISTVVSMLLYLCVQDPDITKRPFSLQAATVSYNRSQTDVTVFDAGWRIGSALRSARARYAPSNGEATGRHVVPHLRRAHWHSYWAGPRSAPERTLLVYYLSPIQVATPRDTLPQFTVVRGAD